MACCRQQQKPLAKQYRTGWRSNLPALAIAFSFFLLQGCASSLPKQTPFTDLLTPTQSLTEQHLLDVGIVVFESDLSEIDDVDWHFLMSRIREAEGRYMPTVLKQTLSHSGQWGDIRILAEIDPSAEVLVLGDIIESNGHTLQLNIHVQDASGQLWFEREYTEYIGENVFGENSLGVNDPFQGIYTRIANDILTYRQQNIHLEKAIELQHIADMHFATYLAPVIFSQYIEKTEDNTFNLIGLPDTGDPYLLRVQKIQVRDSMFHEVMQQYYTNYARDLAEIYYRWRFEDYRERKHIAEQKKSRAGNLIYGTLMLGTGAVLAIGDNFNKWQRLASTIIAGVGGEMVSKGLDGFNVSTALLEETAASFGETATTQVINLDDRTISLTGTVQDQYRQWRDLLETMYQVETEIEPVEQELFMPGKSF